MKSKVKGSIRQDLKTMEQRYQGKWDVNMLADYCWNIKRDLPEQKRTNKRKPVRRTFDNKRVRYRRNR